jgi:hypothetical protein
MSLDGIGSAQLQVEVSRKTVVLALAICLKSLQAGLYALAAVEQQ